MKWEQRFVSSRSKPRHRLLGISAAALLFIANGSSIHELPPPEPSIRLVASSDAEIRSEIENETFGASKMYRAMKKHFPEEYEAMIAMQIDGYRKNQDRISLLHQGAAFTAELRHRVAGEFRKASLETHRAYIAAMVPMLEHLQSRYGFEACNAMSIGGGQALMDEIGGETIVKDLLILASMDEMAGIFLMGAAEGADQGIQPEPPSMKDWSRAFRELAASGMSKGDVDLVIKANLSTSRTDPLFCNAVTNWLRGIARLSGEGTERIIHAIAFAAARS